MNRIGLRQLSQNPAGVAEGLKRGESYSLTQYNREIGVIVPISSVPLIVPPKRRGGARTSSIARVGLTSAASMDELLDREKGEW